MELATRAEAAVLRRDDIGILEAAMAADFVVFRIDDLEHAGALLDPVAALLTCAPARVWLSVINGRIVVEGGSLVGMESAPLLSRHNRISRRILERAGLA